MRLLLTFLLSVSSFAFAEVYELDQMNFEARGETFAVGGHDNAVYVIEAWFNGCPYCHQNAPNVGALAESVAELEGVYVIDLGRDRSDYDYDSWIRRHNPDHLVLRDSTSRSLLRDLGVRAYPTAFVLDCNLNKHWTHVGVWRSYHADEIRDTIAELQEVECIVEE